MPWGMWDYPRTYTGLLKGSGVLHERLLSLRSMVKHSRCPGSGRAGRLRLEAPCL